RAQQAAFDGKQPGDPAKAAAAIITALSADTTPLRLPLGNDAADAIAASLNTTRAELAAWEQVTRATDFDTRPSIEHSHLGERNRLGPGHIKRQGALVRLGLPWSARPKRGRLRRGGLGLLPGLPERGRPSRSAVRCGVPGSGLKSPRRTVAAARRVAAARARLCRTGRRR